MTFPSSRVAWPSDNYGIVFIQLMHIRKDMHAVIRSTLCKVSNGTEEGVISLIIKSRNRPVAVQPTLADLHHVEHQEACLYFYGNYTLVIWMSSKCSIVRPYSPTVLKAPQPRPKKLLQSLPRPSATTGNRLLRALRALDSQFSHFVLGEEESFRRH